jgi:hypothetical protein
MKGVNRSDLGASCDCLGEPCHLGAFLTKPGLGHPLRQHPDIDVEHRHISTEEIGARTQGLLEDSVVALDICLSRFLDLSGARLVADIAVGKQLS